MGAIADVYGKTGYARGFLVFVLLAVISIFIIYVLLKNMRIQTKNVKP
jgi:hypothetical protein